MTTANRHYTAEQRAKIRNSVIQLIEERLTNAQIAERLNAQGFTTPQGTPCTETTAAGVIQQMGGKRKFIARAKRRRQKEFGGSKGPVIKPVSSPVIKKITPVEARAPRVIIDVLSNPSLSAQTKINMLLAYYQ